MTTEQLIESLLDPQTYPHPVQVITTIETHISIVFLTGDFAYKLKKPVDFGFLDFSSLDKRKKFCQLEVELNQRTAPELYLGVFELHQTKQNKLEIKELTKQNDDSVNNNASDSLLDYVVKMKQFNPNHVLGKLLKQNTFFDDNIWDKLALQISQFHGKAQTVELSSELGLPKTQLQPMLDNFPTLFKHFTDSETVAELNQLQDWTYQEFENLKAFITDRRNNGFVKACHGDLHLDNIAIIDNQPLLFDGIEFNEHFRWIDVCSDLAFLLIDMQFKGNKSASNQVLSLYLSKTLDYQALPLLNFYRVYRTLVRAKITALRSEQLISGSIDHQQVLQTALDYIHQASSYLQPNKSPKCLLMQGVSGSGKSTFANQIMEQCDLDAIVISSDRIRKTLYGIDSKTRVRDAEKSQLYSSKMNQKTYDYLLQAAETCLKNGFNVIVDATFLKHEHRAKFYQLNHSYQNAFDFYLIQLDIKIETAKQSLIARQQDGQNPSDANIDVMQNQLKAIEPATESEKSLTLKAEQIRQIFPQQTIQEFLALPINQI